MPTRDRFARIVPLILTLVVVAVYAHSLPAPFIFDDQAAILDNATIRDLGNLTEVLSPPRNGAGVTGRPLVNVSLALNHAAFGFDVRGYRATNLAIHVLTALALWGLLRRTLRRLENVTRPVPNPDLVAFAITLLWTIHPLQTETVTCVIQRTEGLVSLFYVLTLYCFIRAVDTTRPPAWLAAMLAACATGMATKEVMVTAPVMVFFYDRTFVAGAFSAAWRQRWHWYAGLAATWVLLAFLVIDSGANRGTSAGFGLSISSWEYALTQCRAIMLYVRLTFWPDPLIADYGSIIVRSPVEVLLPGLMLLALLATTLIAVWRWPAVGFTGVWFFGLLAPSSSVVPLITQTIAEHRVYLPLAAILALATVGLFRYLPRHALLACGALTLAAGAVTVARNHDYLDEERLWRKNIQDLPDSARAYNNLGRLLANRQQPAEAIIEYEAALRLDPRFAHAHYNLALALENVGRHGEAATHYALASAILPHFADAEIQLGKIRLHQARPEEALASFQRALDHQPHLAEAHFHAGLALVELGRTPEAVLAYARALDANPDFAAAAINLGEALCQLGQFENAIAQLSRIMARNPDLPEVHFNLGVAFARSGRAAESMHHYGEAVRLKPVYPAARLNYGIALAQAGQLPQAVAQLQEAVALAPDSPEAQANLGNVLWESGFSDDAITHYERALALRPDYVSAHFNLSRALLALGRTADARHHAEAAVRLAPDFAPAAELLRQLDRS